MFSLELVQVEGKRNDIGVCVIFLIFDFKL